MHAWMLQNALPCSEHLHRCLVHQQDDRLHLFMLCARKTRAQHSKAAMLALLIYNDLVVRCDKHCNGTAHRRAHEALLSQVPYLHYGTITELFELVAPAMHVPDTPQERLAAAQPETAAWSETAHL